jgi:hypothetical protein
MLLKAVNDNLSYCYMEDVLLSRCVVLWNEVSLGLYAQWGRRDPSLALYELPSS